VTYLDRLRVSQPATSPKQAAEAKRALREGMDLLRQEGLCTPSLQAVVWRLLQDAAETLSRLDDPDRRFQRGLHANWPPVMHSVEEWTEAETQRLVALREDKWQIRMPSLRIADPGAISRMMIVLDWLKYTKGRNVKRDKAIALNLAVVGPKRTKRKLIAEGMLPPDISDSALRMVKQKVIWHIARALSPISY